MTGSRADAEAALRYGLISEIVATDELVPSCLKIARRIASRAPLSVEANKRVLRSLVEHGEQVGQLRFTEEVVRLAQSADHQLAVDYFGTGTPPPFTRS
jgi:enoyl-CoA hydratase